MTRLLGLLLVAVLSPAASGCTLSGTCTDGFHEVDGKCVFGGASDAGRDAGPRDAATTDGGRDAGPDSGANDAGPCPSGCAPPLTCMDGACRDPVVELAAGYYQTCARLMSGRVMCWGGNEAGELGTGSTETFSVMPDYVRDLDDDAIDLDAQSGHTCAVRRTGRIACWGTNEGGQLGDGTLLNRRTPVEVVGIATATQVAGGGTLTCARLEDGSLRCWGLNTFGQLGDGTMTASPTPVRVARTDTFVEVRAGSEFACGRTEMGAVVCWGENDHGQLGDGTMTPRAGAANVMMLPDARALLLAGNHACAQRSTLSLVCWGENTRGQVGDGTMADRALPTSIFGLGGVAALGMAEENTCVVTSDGHVHCWGANRAGQIGDMTTTTRTSPTEAMGISDAEQVEVGTGGWTCALRRGGRVSCWGDNAAGQLGDGTRMTSAVPVDVVGLP